MIKRYTDEKINKIWSDLNKLELWQRTEIAVIQAMANLGKIDKKISKEIATLLNENPIDLKWWLKRDGIIHHDLKAFLEERLRFLSTKLQIYFHRNITSYDTEEPAFAKMLKQSIGIVDDYCLELMDVLKKMAIEHRYTIMNGRTHGQEAELQTFGKRCLTWIQDLRFDFANLKKAEENLKYSKLSGAIGNYGGIEPALEKEALKILEFQPYYGATQIMPREVYAPIAQALCQITLTLDKIAVAIRLGARSGIPIYQEPFSKKQKGSSAMPHKKNTIRTENIAGMSRMAQGYLQMIISNIVTWEERAIDQSSVERVAWPDLFHVLINSIKNMTRVLDGLVVYPDNMLLEIINSYGCYASSEAKELLKDLGAPFELSVEEAYRIVQLASFNAFEVSDRRKKLRENTPKSLVGADDVLGTFSIIIKEEGRSSSIKGIISQGLLSISWQLEASEKDVQRWNGILEQIFSNPENVGRWDKIFRPSYLLRGEETLYEEILNI